MADERTPTTDRPYWRGINHLALITTDMDATVRFYHGVLGARLVAHLAGPSFRHYFFDFGPEQTVAFFEYRGEKLAHLSKPAGVPHPMAVQFDHLSFNLPDEEALHALRDRLKTAGCDVTDVVDHGFIHSIYFTDNNGIALEASWWLVDPTGRPTDYADEGLFSDPDPVPAVRELRERGELASTPVTRLVSDVVVDPA